VLGCNVVSYQRELWKVKDMKQAFNSEKWNNSIHSVLQSEIFFFSLGFEKYLCNRK